MLRLTFRSFLEIIRSYPVNPRDNIISLEQAELLGITANSWQCSLSIIPTRGDDIIQSNRRHNLRLAISLINGMRIPPAGIFSMMKIIGEPSKLNGFRDGPVFIDGQVKSDVGGGLCLIATNLYSLFLYSGFEIIERHNHSIDAYGEDRFYKLGEDAAIVYGYKDLVVRNPYANECLLKILFSGNDVRSELLSSVKLPVHVNVQSTVLERIPMSIGLSNPGWTLNTVRHIRPDRQGSNWRLDYSSYSFYKPC